ncbi:MAG: GNAT family N-acetyltransferase [Deltaproteobacteria bacterium]|nr:GNAT family N-acetyltransferase [Deltaproteobacteria bacterium]
MVGHPDSLESSARPQAGETELAAAAAVTPLPALLHGPRVRLRALTLDDVEAVFAYASDPEVTRYVEWTPHRTQQEAALYIQRCNRADQRRSQTFGVELLASRRVIGAFDLRIVSHVWRIGEIGYTIARSHWGQGYNLEAGQLLIDYGFRALGLRRIQAVCDVANRRSYRTMEKLGMRREFIIYRARYQDGRPIDRYRYSIRRREWQRHPLYQHNQS